MKTYTTIFLLIISLIFSCISKTDSSVSNSESKTEFSRFDKDSIKGAKWIKTIHDSIKEPNLKHLDYECYRFNYLDAFGKNKLFRIEHFNDSHNRLVVKFYDKDKNYDAEIYSITSEKTIDLSAEQFKEFKELINGSYFWSMNMFENPKRGFLDGYAFLLEGFEPKSASKKERYQIVAREVPYNGSFKEACEKLMEFYNQEKK